MVRVLPYIGVTGFMEGPEVSAVLEQFPPHSHRMLMVGVLASSKTLSGQQNRWPGRYPRIEKVAEIFCDHPMALNLVHYCTDDPLTLGEQLVLLHRTAGPRCHGVQLNVPWPRPEALREYRRVFPDAVIILQIGQEAFHEVGGLLRLCVARLGAYRSLMDDVLFDMSGGLGKPMSVGLAHKFLELLQGEECGTGGIAGGLSVHALSSLAELFQQFPEVSIDAEGRLRHADNDQLDLSSAVRYVQEAQRLLGVVPS